jgi:hypothetical protein
LKARVKTVQEALAKLDNENDAIKKYFKKSVDIQEKSLEEPELIEFQEGEEEFLQKVDLASIRSIVKEYAPVEKAAVYTPETPLRINANLILGPINPGTTRFRINNVMFPIGYCATREYIQAIRVNCVFKLSERFDNGNRYPFFEILVNNQQTVVGHSPDLVARELFALLGLNYPDDSPGLGFELYGFNNPQILSIIATNFK